MCIYGICSRKCKKNCFWRYIYEIIEIILSIQWCVRNLRGGVRDSKIKNIVKKIFVIYIYN